MRLNVLVDVCRRGEGGRVATNVDGIWILVHSNIVDAQRGWEAEMIEVDRAEVLGHAQVRDEVLQSRCPSTWGKRGC